MKKLRGTHYSFQNLTQFIMLNQVIDFLVSNINDSLKRATVLPPSLESGEFAKSDVPHP
jgi:hypothetical protein